MTDQVKEKIPTRVPVRLNMITALPSDGLTTDPVIHQAGEVIEVDVELAKRLVNEHYRRAPTKMCERKGGDFLLPEYTTRATYV